MQSSLLYNAMSLDSQPTQYSRRAQHQCNGSMKHYSQSASTVPLVVVIVVHVVTIQVLVKAGSQ